MNHNTSIKDTNISSEIFYGAVGATVKMNKTAGQTKHHDPQSLRKLYMNYIHAMLEYLHLKLICIPSFEHDIQCTTFATNHIREGEIPNLLSFWVPQKEYEKF